MHSLNGIHDDFDKPVEVPRVRTFVTGELEYVSVALTNDTTLYSNRERLKAWAQGIITAIDAFPAAEDVKED